MSRRSFLVLALAFMTAASVAGCSTEQAPPPMDRKLSIVTTLFPLYDFAGTVAGDRARVVLLLPPGAEPHSYEPKPADILALEKADIFVYTGRHMEPWAASLLKGLRNRSLLIVDASEGIRLREGPAEGAHDRHDHDVADSRMDPHIWLDFSNAMAMVDTVAGACAGRDPGGAATYRRNAESLKTQLAALDGEYAAVLSQCRTRTLLHGGHFAFNYMAERYGLKYLSAYKSAPDSDPGPRDIAAMTSTMRQLGLRYLFYEELISPRVAQTIARETGAQLLRLHAGHNVTKEELQRQVTFVSIMKENLTNLRKGLQCP